MGVESHKFDVIYNGVDTDVFVEAPNIANLFPTVVMVARIDPIKDILTLIRSCAIVKKQIPNVKFIVYGSVSVPDYYEECLKLKDQLQLGDSFIFAGHTSNMAAAYQSGDVIALSSISEAFPYSVVEAMMTAKPVVSTDVGGIKEALGDTGILVEPRNPEEMAKGLVTLLKDARLRDYLGKEARERALNYFTLDRVLDLHLKSYVRLAVGGEERVVVLPKENKGKSHAEKGFALMTYFAYEQAIEQFGLAIKQEPGSPAVPVYLAEIAKAYQAIGDFDQAFVTMEKIHALVGIHHIA